MTDPLSELTLRIEELEAWRTEQEAKTLALEEADKLHEARFGRHSDRAKTDELTAALAFTTARDAQRSVHDIEETFSEPDRAMLAVNRQIAGESAQQTKAIKKLAWTRWFLVATPFVVAIGEIFQACSGKH
jgi:hypothetical protein